jgi:cellulose synthase/poly-beta-1,6-N-acetylglucosamine synthase-like glycosyltransferase
MDTHLSLGERVVQAHYAVLNPERGWSVSLRYAALAVLHYVRPLARRVLGTSTGLKGNGMLFHRTVLQQHGWSASVTEDIEYHMSLLLAGECVSFAPTATVWADMPVSLQGAHAQNVRWESGRIEMIRRYVPNLLWQALRNLTDERGTSAKVLLDAAAEHLIPPFSVLAGASICYLAAALLLGSTPGLLVAAFVIGGQSVYLLSGLVMTHAPRDVYLGLLHAPLFLLWKLWLYVRVLLGWEQQGWVRTARDDA